MGGVSIKNLSLISSDFKASKLICHRIPERTFKIKGRYFPVCSRCTGFYLAGFSYYIYAYFVYVDYTFYLVFFAILMLVPTFIDGFTQLINLRQSKNSLRFLTGLIGGIGLAILFKALKWFILVKGGF